MQYFTKFAVKTSVPESNTAHVENKLRDGDVLLLRAKNDWNPLRTVIKAVTRSPYSHAAMYANGRVYDSILPVRGVGRQAEHPGGQNISFEEFNERDNELTYDVFRPKLQAAREAVKNIENVATETKNFSPANLLSAGLKDVTGIDWILNKDRTARICSQMINDAFNGTLGEKDNIVSPAWFARHPDLKQKYTIDLHHNTEKDLPAPVITKSAGLEKLIFMH